DAGLAAVRFHAVTDHNVAIRGHWVRQIYEDHVPGGDVKLTWQIPKLVSQDLVPGIELCQRQRGVKHGKPYAGDVARAWGDSLRCEQVVKDHVEKLAVIESMGCGLMDHAAWDAPALGVGPVHVQDGTIGGLAPANMDQITGENGPVGTPPAQPGIGPY